MKRTTIMLPPELKTKAQKAADKLGISLGELIRESIDYFINKRDDTVNEDTFFSDTAVFKGESPADGSIKHDGYLYEDML